MAGACKLIQDTGYKIQDTRYGKQVWDTGKECRKLMLVTIN